MTQALAVAKCGNGVSQTFSKAEATSTVLGFCGLFDLGFGQGAGWSNTNTESGATGNAFGDAGGFGSTDGYNGWGRKRLA